MVRKKVSRKRALRRVSHRKVKLKFKHLDKKSKIKFVVNQLLFFIALCLVSLVLFQIVKNLILSNLFSVLAMITGFIAVAFLIALLILIIKKIIKK
jgi:hypothetical protein